MNNDRRVLGYCYPVKAASSRLAYDSPVEGNSEVGPANDAGMRAD